MINFLTLVLIQFLPFLLINKDQNGNQKQDFEEGFVIVNAPVEFLPGWTANEVRATSSRIFQTNLGRNNSKALAVQPISTFNGELTISLINEDFEDPKVEFWARSIQNGTGTRAAEVYISWKNDSESSFSQPTLLGSLLEFENQNQDFRKFQLEIPDSLKTIRGISLKIEVRYGAGTGSAARWIMDDFEFGDFEVDLKSPALTQIKGFDSNQLELTFDETLDPVFPLFQVNYDLEGIEPESVILKNDTLVYLLFDQDLVQGKDYSLRVKQIPDLSGNFLSDTLVNFTFYDPTDIPAKGLVINEIMPAPRADLDLPNVEYVELFHAGDFPYRLKNVIWANSRTQVKLDEFWILPGEFLILVPQNQAIAFEPYGKVLEVASWPTLLNSGDRLRIETDKGEKIDELAYATANWGGTEFANGGYSLEISNPFYACEQSEFLIPSKDPLRGTPGRRNSIFDPTSDSEFPRLEEGYFINSTMINMRFSEPIIPNATSLNFSFSPDLELDSVKFLDSRSIQLILKSEAISNQVYQLEINGISDCSGNESPNSDSIELILPTPAKKGDLIINELLFNPKTGSPKFVELYNRTDEYLEIGDWNLANLNELGGVDQIRRLAENRLQFPPKSFLSITTNIDRLKLDYPMSSGGAFHLLSTLPSYPISGGNVVLLDSEESLAELFSYNEDLHHPLLRDPKGVSLERVSSESPISNVSNWHSASGIAGYATPGMKNSQLISNEFDGEILQIEPKVFDPEGSNGNTFTSIRYQLDQSGWIGNFRIYTISGQLIQVLAQNELLGVNGLFTWTGTDTQGRIVRPGYYILLVELYDIQGNIKVIKETIAIATSF
jgi:hypothetical protein